MRDILESTRAYEVWMRKRTTLAEKRLRSKHRKMAAGAIPFLRASFYPWAEQWPVVCPRLAGRDEDVLLTIGDLHVENFGIWRDAQTRLVCNRIAHWFRTATERMADSTRQDHAEWAKRFKA